MNSPQRFSHFLENLLVYLLSYRPGFFFVPLQPVRQIAYELVRVGNAEHDHSRLVSQVAYLLYIQLVFPADFFHYFVHLQAKNSLFQIFGKIIVHLGYLFFSKIFHKFFKLFYGVVFPPPPFPPPPPAPELLNFAPNFSESCLVSYLSTCFSVASLSAFFSFKTIFTPFILGFFPSSLTISFFISSTGSPACMALYNLEFCSAKSTEISSILFSINLKAFPRYPPIFSPVFSIISSSFSFSPLSSIPLIRTSFLITLPLLSLLSLIPANIAKLSLYFSSSY